MPELLDETSLETELASLPEWKKEGAELVRTFSFPYYLAGISFVNEVANRAETLNHHPDIQIGWRKVTLRISTHSKGGLTELDFNLAREVDALVA
ncbi:MAG: 4a-hydroxytetrahydrobiopterin dehydratase [Verrucomicrobium sp.]|nr:4a-hydroxytetrahydrobiopterin dehydratase [Verrucomicrobium sp.]